MTKLQCWVAQGRGSSSYHLAAFSSVFSPRGFLYKVLRCVINLSLGAICHVLNVVFWMEMWLCITVLKLAIYGHRLQAYGQTGVSCD